MIDILLAAALAAALTLAAPLAVALAPRWLNWRNARRWRRDVARNRMYEGRALGRD